MSDTEATKKVARNLSGICRICGEPGYPDIFDGGPAYCAEHLPEGESLSPMDDDTREVALLYSSLPPEAKAYIKGLIVGLVEMLEAGRNPL